MHISSLKTLQMAVLYPAPAAPHPRIKHTLTSFIHLLLCVLVRQIKAKEAKK